MKAMPNAKVQMTNEAGKNARAKMYDLEERTAKFGEQVIVFAKTLPHTEVVRPLINQLVRSGTSVGANYMEADGAESKRDFRHKIGICKKEAKESRHWLRMIAIACPESKGECRRLWKEANELSLIFAAIVRNMAANDR